MSRMHNPKNTRRPPLEEVQAFVDVATFGSFNAAGEALRISHSSLSRKVAHLEQWLGTALFQRTSQGVTLTGPGMQYFLRFRDGLRLIELPVKAGDGTSDENVQVSVLRGFGVFWLFPRHNKLIR